MTEIEIKDVFNIDEAKELIENCNLIIANAKNPKNDLNNIQQDIMNQIVNSSCRMKVEENTLFLQLRIVDTIIKFLD